MNKLTISFHSLIIAILFYVLYPKTKGFLYPKEFFEYLGSFINVESSRQFFVFGMSINILHTLVTALCAGFIASILFLSKLNKNWKAYGVISTIIYLLFCYIMLIFRFQLYFEDQEIGVQISYIINPLLAGAALFLAIWMLSQFRKRLPDTN